MATITVKKHHTLKGHKDAIYALCEYDESRFFSAGGDGMIVCWDLKSPEIGKMIVKVPSSVYSMAFDAKSQKLVVGQNFSGIQLIDVNSNQSIGSLALTTSQIFAITIFEDFIYVATGTGEVYKVGWDLRVHDFIKLCEKSIRSLLINSESREIIAGSSDHNIYIVGIDGMNENGRFAAHDNSVFTLASHSDRKLLISSGRDARIKIWDTLNDYQQKEAIVAHMYAINDLKFSADNRYFATASMDKTVKIWDAQTFKLLKVIDKPRHGGHLTSVNKLLWMQYHNWLVSCSDDRTLSVWEINEG